jgi:hypothetical protein
MQLDGDDIKRRATGRWLQIYQSLLGLTAEQLDPGRHGPCPMCGGTDRFRARNSVAEDGALYCNKCFHDGARDGFAAVMWMTGCTFPEALRRVADCLGLTSSPVNGPAKSSPNRKKIHETPDAVVMALAWSYAKAGKIDGERKPDQAWQYQNAAGEIVMIVARWNLAGDAKTFGQIHRVDGGWVCGGMPEPRPLLNLPVILQANEVWVVEGEKAASAMDRLGLPVTTSSQGSKSPKLSDWSVLAGKSVHIVPDNDSDGDSFAAQVVSLIRQQAPGATVDIRWLKDDWPEIPEHGDAADWLYHLEWTEPEILRKRLEVLQNRISEYNIPEPEGSQEEEPKSPPRSFAGQPASELWSLADEPVQWMVENVFSLEQPTVIGARKKSLKTTLLSSLVVSLVTGLPWLGRFKIPRKFRVLFVTGEATKRAAIRKIRKAAEALNVKPEALEGLRIEAVNFPKFPSEADLEAISEDVRLHKIDIVVIDPLYRGMDSTINAQNIFAMGDALGRFMVACSPASVILSHHVKKSAQFDKSAMPDLDDLSQAGVAEFAGNYLLIGRLTKYEGDGRHDLAICIGGRDEQFGQYRLEFDETTFTGHLTDLKDHEAHQRQLEENSKVVELMEKIVEELQALANHETSESHLASLCSTKPDRKHFKAALKELGDRKTIVCLREYKPPHSKVCRGWKLNETTSDKSTSDMSEVTV